jgi:surfeit locus 1 family protein
MTALTIAACVAFVGLGRWQWHKGNLRQTEWENFARGAGKVLQLDAPTAAEGQGPSARRLDALALSEVPRFQTVSLIGRFDENHQFLLDNRTYGGRAGYEVLTPLERSDGRVVLVDRGWVPFSGLRERLPGVALMRHEVVTIQGRVDTLPSAGLASGRARPDPGSGWPKVTSYPTMRELSTALGQPLEPSIVLLDPKEPDGYVRDWHPPGVQPIRHWSYAVQWWSFAILALVLWMVLSTRRVGSS